MPEPVEVVDIFRKGKAIPAIVEEAIAAGATVIWMQLGLESPEAVAGAQAAGLAGGDEPLYERLSTVSWAGDEMPQSNEP